MVKRRYAKTRPKSIKPGGHWRPRLFKCMHMGFEFTALVRYSRKHECYVIETSIGDVYYLSTIENVHAILNSFDKCEEVLRHEHG